MQSIFGYLEFILVLLFPVLQEKSTYFPFPLDKLYLPHSILNYIISSFLQLLHSFIVRDFTIEILPSFIHTDNCQFLALSRFLHSSVILPCYLLCKTSFFSILRSLTPRLIVSSIVIPLSYAHSPLPYFSTFMHVLICYF